MPKFYITMGQSHRHVINGIVIDKDSLVEVEAEDYESAYQIAHELFGRVFCTLYEEGRHNPEFYHRGIVLSI